MTFSAEMRCAAAGLCARRGANMRAAEPNMREICAKYARKMVPYAQIAIPFADHFAKDALLAALYDGFGVAFF